ANPAAANAPDGLARARATARELGFQTLASGLPALFHPYWWNGAFYVHTNLEAPNYRVLKAKPSEIALGPDHWREIVPESQSKLDNADVIGNSLVLSYLENASSRIQIHDLEGKQLRSVTLPGIGSASG